MANVMKPAMGRMQGPYADNAYIPTSTHGWVHANSWYASVPFNSAPPPAPAGINPQMWANGQWQANPYFRPPQGMTQPPNSFQMWAPHPGWGAAAGGQSRNPYKRIPNPGDASYWATKLSDNPLGLENMHIKDDTPAEERHRKDSPNGVPHTPWVWVPKELSSDTSKSAENTGASGSRDGQGGQPQPAQSQRDPPPTAYRRDGYDHSRSNSSSGNAYAPPATAHDSSSQSRHYQHDASRPVGSTNYSTAPSSAPPAVSTYSVYQQQQQQQRHQQQQPSQHQQQSHYPQQQQQSQPQYQQDTQRSTDRYPASSQTPPDHGQHQRRRSQEVSPRPSHDSQQAYPSRDYRGAPVVSSSASAAAAAAAAASRQPEYESRSAARDREQERRDEAFSARRELLPTFSPNIVRTPDHYHTSARLPASDRERTPTRHPTTPTPGRIYPPSSVPTRSNSLNAGSQSSQGNTISANSSLGLIAFTDEPDSVLSPLIVPGETPKENTSSRSSRNPSPTREESYRRPSRNHSRNPSRNPSPLREDEYYRPEQKVRMCLDYMPDEYNHPVYRKTPHNRARTLSPDRDRDRAREREQRDDYRRYRETDATPQPGARTPPAHTPPLSHYMRPSPEGRSGGQPISRSQTYPVMSPPPITPQRSKSPQRFSPVRGQLQASPSPYHQQASTSPYHQRGYIPAPLNPPPPLIPGPPSPLRHNPLPRPPQTHPYADNLLRGGTSSASAAAAALAAQQQQMAPRRSVRYGYWNRRGDHLYIDSRTGHRYVVYAPRHLANPEELRNYPSATEGWRDHHGNFIKYDSTVRELPESLPRHGEAPEQPYSNFVTYVDV
ncbi:hypothetical protein PYCCODRAFT_1463401 [Trametes coccinea BRFM310]|uniref:Uncharacterized protein n=1 Tax=Trametes coccinea (strain BRFM310) TaxID=1353009 RepID=A0A1Y2J5J0_TRAC3|nr:hypothetical protein PYCCODRAFT_1463401 [Trametes coccinea BRFM310]